MLRVRERDPAGGRHRRRSAGRPALTAGTTGVARACIAVSLMAAGAFRNRAGRPDGRTGGGRIALAGRRQGIYRGQGSRTL